jgi:hypothetical protein
MFKENVNSMRPLKNVPFCFSDGGLITLSFNKIKTELYNTICVCKIPINEEIQMGLKVAPLFLGSK